MREFSGYCVPSAEYRQNYVLEAQQNLELREKAVMQNNIILALQKELAATKQELSDKNATVDDLKGQLEHQKKETAEWVERFEIQDLKTERAHQRRMEVEQKVCRLEKIAVGMRAETEKMKSVQVILGGQVRSFKHKVEEQRSVITDKEAFNQQLVAKVDDLKSLCQQANKKTDEDASIIQKLKSTINEQNEQLGECNDFITFVREREGNLVARLGQLKEYYQAKRQQRCMFFHRNNRRPSHPAEEIVLGIGKLLVKEKFDIQTQTSAVRQLI